MKTQAMNRLYLVKIFTGMTAILFILSFALNQFAYGAGTSSNSSSKSESAAQKRERANEYFEEGKNLQEKWNYKKASKKYELGSDETEELEEFIEKMKKQKS